MMNQDGVTEHTGFPNPATDSTLVSLDIGQLLVKHPAATFFMEIDNHAWEKFGIFSGDIAIIDKSLNPRDHDIVVWWQDTNFCLSYFSKTPVDTIVWGIVTSIVHRYRP